jgi:hypothetical protein
MSRLLLYAAFCCALAHAQTPMPTALSIDLQNVVEYQADISDPSKFATSPGITPAVTFKISGQLQFSGTS